MMIIGCDFHPRFQQIAFIDQDTGEYGELRLSHKEEAERFYRTLAGRQVRVGAEATGNFRWFRQLMQELGHEFLLGDASAIRAACPRRQKTDKRDARHILNMLVEDRFPVVWQPPVENELLRQLLLHRCRMVRMRARVKNQLDSMAKDEGLLSARVWCPKRRQEIEALPLPGWYGLRRSDLLGVLDEMDKRIKPLDKAMHQAAEDNPEARLLMCGAGGFAGLCADHRRLETVSSRQADRQLSGPDPGRGVQLRQAPPGAHQQAGQHAAALVAGGGRQ
jgi:hypothetical protein